MTLTRVPYASGTKPTAPGPYVTFDHVPADAVALLTAAIPKPPAPHRRHRLRTPLLALFLALIAAAVVSDRAAGFDRWMFTQVLFPTAAAGILLVMLGTHSRPGPALAEMRRLDAARVAGILGTAIPVVMIAGVVSVLMSETFGAGLLRLAPVLAVVLLVVLARRLRDRPSSALTRRESAQVEMMTACRDVVAALSDDVAAGKTIAGWTDLTGAQQPGKLLAQGTSASGARVELFRDEWFCFTAPLRDGTRVRVVAADREKYKHPRRSGKPGRTQTLPTLEIRARINPQVYRTLAPEVQTGPVHALQLTSIKATPDVVSAVFTRAEGLHLAEVMHALAHVYRHLERLPAADGGAP